MMKSSGLTQVCIGLAVLALGSVHAAGQVSTGDFFDDSGSTGAATGDGSAGGTSTGGLGEGVTTPPATTPVAPAPPTDGGTGGTALTPRNSVSNIPQFTGFKTRMRQFQFPTGSGASSAASAAAQANPFRDAFLIPFIQSIFEELQTFIVTLAASSALGNALPPTTSAPA